MFKRYIPRGELEAFKVEIKEQAAKRDGHEKGSDDGGGGAAAQLRILARDAGRRMHGNEINLRLLDRRDMLVTAQ